MPKPVRLGTQPNRNQQPVIPARVARAV